MKIIIHALFALYVYVLFKIILFKFSPVDTGHLWQQLKWSMVNPDAIVRRLHHGNLIPFHEISSTIQNVTHHSLLNLYGNIAIFIPLGIFLGFMARGNRSITYLGIFLRSLGLSLFLEGAQVLFALGSFDVDDLILNAGGGMLGFLFYKIGSTLFSNHIPLTESGGMRTRYE